MELNKQNKIYRVTTGDKKMKSSCIGLGTTNLAGSSRFEKDWSILMDHKLTT